MSIYEILKKSGMPYRKTTYAIAITGLLLILISRFDSIPINGFLAITGYVTTLASFSYFDYWLFKSSHKEEAVLILLLIIFAIAILILYFSNLQ